MILPYPPSDNERYIGRTKSLSPKVRAYRRAVQSVVIERSLQGIACDLEARLLLFPKNERRDTCNCFKVLWDTLEHVGVLKNDRQIKEVHVFRGVTHSSDVVCLRLSAWSGVVPDDPEEIAKRPNTIIARHDAASLAAGIVLFETKIKGGKS